MHHSFIPFVERFFGSHYTFSQGVERAKVSKQTLSYWIKSGMPVVRLSLHKVYLPKIHFDGLANAFKQGRKEGRKAAEKFKRIRKIKRTLLKAVGWEGNLAGGLKKLDNLGLTLEEHLQALETVHGVRPELRHDTLNLLINRQKGKRRGSA